MQTPSSLAEFVFSGKLQSGLWRKCVCRMCGLPCVQEMLPCAIVDAAAMGLLNVDTVKMGLDLDRCLNQTTHHIYFAAKQVKQIQLEGFELS